MGDPNKLCARKFVDKGLVERLERHVSESHTASLLMPNSAGPDKSQIMNVTTVSNDSE